jgi:hypothetical protein
MLRVCASMCVVSAVVRSPRHLFPSNSQLLLMSSQSSYSAPVILCLACWFARSPNSVSSPYRVTLPSSSQVRMSSCFPYFFSSRFISYCRVWACLFRKFFGTQCLMYASDARRADRHVGAYLIVVVCLAGVLRANANDTNTRLQSLISVAVER